MLVDGKWSSSWQPVQADDGEGRFLLGEALTQLDIRAFASPVRFDAAYRGVFKCAQRRLADHPALSASLLCVLALPWVAETVSIDHIKAGYDAIKAPNPNGIVPLGPVLPFAC